MEIKKMKLHDVGVSPARHKRFRKFFGDISDYKNQFGPKQETLEEHLEYLAERSQERIGTFEELSFVDAQPQEPFEELSFGDAQSHKPFEELSLPLL